MPSDLHPLDFTCPRCSAEVAERVDGPWASCREQLRAGQGREAREVEAERFEPAMHVTPNAVALKDD